MNLKPAILKTRLPATAAGAVRPAAFSLIELMIVVTLLGLIVLALMDVFSSTQRAFRASVTQTDVLEGSRAAMELVTADLRRLSPSGDTNAVNLISQDENYGPPAGAPSTATPYQPLQQSLPGGSILRRNVLNYFFLLGRENTKWIGIGYVVNVTNSTSLNTLYRFYAESSTTQPPLALYNLFRTTVDNGRWTNMSPIIDGVFHLVLRAYDANGIELTNGYTAAMKLPPDTTFYPPVNGEVGYFFAGHTVPGSVELQLGVLEDRPLARAQSLPFHQLSQSNYLAGQSGTLHIFRQQVNIPNVDRSAYP